MQRKLRGLMRDEKLALYELRDKMVEAVDVLKEIRIILQMTAATGLNNLSLPDHLRKTYITLNALNKATADEVAKKTGRARAVESGYLNQLTVMGKIAKPPRTGRKQYYLSLAER